MKYLILPLLFLGLSLQGDSPADAGKLRGKNITNPLQPTNHQALGWNQPQIRWEPLSVTTQDGSANYCAPSSASGTTYSCNLTPALTSYGTGGLLIVFKPDITNTGASTLNVNGLGAKTIQKVSSGSLAALVAGDLVATGIYILRYNGTVFVIDPGSGGSGGTITSTGGTINVTGTTNLETNFSLVAGTAQNNDLTGNNNLRYNYVAQNLTNDTGTGTSTGKLVIFTGVPSTVRTALTTSTVVFGGCVSGCANSGTAVIATTGNFSCVFDGATTAGHYVIPSTGTAGDCTDYGATPPPQGYVGQVTSTNVGAGTYEIKLQSMIPSVALGSGTTVSLVGPRQYYVCTGACTVTPPVPAAGMEFCVLNGDNVTGVITLAALGSSARYENTARTAYGTAGTGTFVSAGAAADKVCIVGLDSTHYLTTAFQGTWVAN